MTNVTRVVGVVCLSLALQGTTWAQSGFEFQDGDRVVFLGDSNTGGNMFIQTAEIYTLLRFPTRTVTFFNAGKGGDTAPGGAARLSQDVFSKNPTALVVTYGAADMLGCFLLTGSEKTSCLDTARTSFLNGIVDIIGQCQARVPAVRVYVSSYPVLGMGQEFNDTLQQWGNLAMYLSLALHERIVDVQTTMRAIVGSAPAAPTCGGSNLYNFPDFVPGLHLNDRGHNAWAYSLLKGLNAPAEVSTVTVDATTLTGTATGGTAVSNISGNTAEVHFNRLDPGLPITFGPPLSLLLYGFVPWQNVNAYRLKVTNLQAGSYEIRAEGRLLGQLTDTALAAGQDITNMGPAGAVTEGGPWVVQASAIRSVTTSRAAATAAQGSTSQLAGSPNFALLQTLHGETQGKLADILHATAIPWNYAFEVKRVGP